MLMSITANFFPINFNNSRVLYNIFNLSSFNHLGSIPYYYSTEYSVVVFVFLECLEYSFCGNKLK